MNRSQMPRGTPMKRSGRIRTRKTAKREEKRERRAEWAVAVKAREPRCGYCGGRPTTDAHHVLPKSSLGPDEMWNGRGMCRRCHRYVHENRDEAQLQGFLAHVGDFSWLPGPA